MSSRLGIDVGGTFTDLLLFDDSSGRFYTAKIPTTRQDPLTAIMTGIRRLLDQSAILPSQIERICHGSSAAGHLLLQQNAARTGLLVTEHFEQLLHLARGRTAAPMLSWMHRHKPDAPVDPACTRGIRERIGARGEVLTPLDENQARTAIRQLLATGVEAICVALLHAYANPQHEQRLRALIAELDDQIPVWLASDLLPQRHEYERTLATVINACLAPYMQRFLAEFAGQLNDLGVNADIYTARSDGGLMSARQTPGLAVHTSRSGPAGAVTAAAVMAALAGYPDAIAFDMGGGSGSIALIRDAAPVISRQPAPDAVTPAIAAVASYPIAGGTASVAYVAAPAVLQIASAERAGGDYDYAEERVSVSAASLMLGRLPAQLPDAATTPEQQAAADALTKMAAMFDVDSDQTAQGIVDIFNENLAGALREMAVRQAIDPGDFALVAGGGAGPLLANALALLTGCYPVIVPPAPGVLSALGFLCAGVRHEFTCTLATDLDDITPGRLSDRLTALALDAAAWLTAAGVSEGDQQIGYEADLRYRGQHREISITLDPEFNDQNTVKNIRGRFADEHHRLHGFRSDTPVELVNLRAIASARTSALSFPQQQTAGADAAAARTGQQRIYFDGVWINTPVYQRAQLLAGNRLAGPALIVQSDSSTLLHPDHRAEIDEYLNILIYPENSAAQQEQPVWR
jgi:N-methylhydantoinase A